MQFDPRKCTQKQVYKLLTGSIVPRPIAWVSTRSPDGVNNLAPFSFFNIVSRDPAMVMLSITGPDEERTESDTLRNIRATGEFVVNIVKWPLLEAMALTAARWSPEVDEFEVAGLTAVPATIVKAPMVAESPIHMECQLRHQLQLGQDTLLIGEVVMFHVDDSLLDNGRIDQRLLQPVGRLAGTLYTPVRELVSHPTPKAESLRRSTDR